MPLTNFSVTRFYTFKNPKKVTEDILNKYCCNDVVNIITDYAADDKTFECLCCKTCFYNKSNIVAFDSYSSNKLNYCEECLDTFFMRDEYKSIMKFKSANLDEIVQCLCCGIEKEKKLFGRGNYLTGIGTSSNFKYFCNCRGAAYAFQNFRCSVCVASPNHIMQENCICHYCRGTYGFSKGICDECYNTISTKYISQ